MTQKVQQTNMTMQITAMSAALELLDNLDPYEENAYILTKDIDLDEVVNNLRAAIKSALNKTTEEN